MLMARTIVFKFPFQSNYMATAIKIIGEKPGNFIFESTNAYGLDRVDFGNITVLTQEFAFYCSSISC